MIMVMDVYKFTHMAQGSIYACVNNKCLLKIFWFQMISTISWFIKCMLSIWRLNLFIKKHVSLKVNVNFRLLFSDEVSVSFSVWKWPQSKQNVQYNKKDHKKHNNLPFWHVTCQGVCRVEECR
jgi:hypothetical protein